MKPWVYPMVLTAMFLPGMSLAEEDMSVLDRHKMVEEQIVGRGVSDEKTLEAMRKVPRHLFVPKFLRVAAYRDQPLPIGHDQTISQPFIVAYMTQEAGIGPEDRVLEIGTGSGYQAAVLAEIAQEVYTVEILQELADPASARLEELGYKNVKVQQGDGYQGWPEHAPFDAIVITAAPPTVPETLLEQLKVGGRMVLPVGSFYQELVRITRTETGFDKETLIPVSFVPMVHGKDSARENAGDS